MVLAQYLVDAKDLLEKPIPFYLIWKPVPPEKICGLRATGAEGSEKNVKLRRRRRKKYKLAPKAPGKNGFSTL